MLKLRENDCLFFVSIDFSRIKDTRVRELQSSCTGGSFWFRIGELVKKRKDHLCQLEPLSTSVSMPSIPKQYSGWDGQLTACEFDANDMQALAKTQGFTKVTKRLTKKATRNRVLADIKAAAGKLKRNDIFFLTYSGHGGQVPNTGNDFEPDGFDETWCLYDGELIDDELYDCAEAIRQGRADLRTVGQLPQRHGTSCSALLRARSNAGASAHDAARCRAARLHGSPEVLRQTPTTQRHSAHENGCYRGFDLRLPGQPNKRRRRSQRVVH